MNICWSWEYVNMYDLKGQPGSLSHNIDNNMPIIWSGAMCMFLNVVIYSREMISFDCTWSHCWRQRAKQPPARCNINLSVDSNAGEKKREKFIQRYGFIRLSNWLDCILNMFQTLELMSSVARLSSKRWKEKPQYSMGFCAKCGKCSGWWNDCDAVFTQTQTKCTHIHRDTELTKNECRFLRQQQ